MKTRNLLKLDSNMLPKEIVSRFTESGNDIGKVGGALNSAGVRFKTGFKFS